MVNFILVSPCIFHSSLFIKHRQNALHFYFYYVLIDPYICFGLCKKTIIRGFKLNIMVLILTRYFTGHNIQNQEQITARDVDVTQ